MNKNKLNNYVHFFLCVEGGREKEERYIKMKYRYVTCKIEYNAPRVYKNLCGNN